MSMFSEPLNIYQRFVNHFLYKWDFKAGEWRWREWSHIGRSFDILVPPGVISFSHLWNIPRISSLGVHWFMGIGTGVIIMINNDSDDDYYDDESNHNEQMTMERSSKVLKSHLLSKTHLAEVVPTDVPHVAEVHYIICRQRNR